MKRALVTGSRGFVGRHVTQHLTSDGWDVTGIDVEYADIELSGRGCEYLSVPLRHNLPSVRYDLVVHAAARGANRRAIDTDDAAFPYNVMLDSAMFSWAIRTRPYHFVYLSSSAVYPKNRQTGNTTQRLRESFVDLGRCEEPFDSYGWTKLTGERMADAARAAGLIVTVVRPFSGYGEDQTEDFPFRAFIERARRREDPFKIWGNAKQVRDFIHIDDVVRGIMAVVESATALPVNLCTGRPTSMETLAYTVQHAVRYTPVILIDPFAPLGVQYRVGDTDVMTNFYEPKISLEEGVRRALR